jgi:hypothetical protein
MRKGPWSSCWGLWFALLAVFAVSPAAATSPYADWAAVVVAGDDRSAHDDTPTEAFENARRDVSAAFLARGFSRSGLAALSMHPARYPADHAGLTSLDSLWSALRAGVTPERVGCLVYLTSHGSPEGVVVSDRLVPPPLLAAVIDHACGARPTAVILSACFSGVFIPALQAPNHLVFTAARRDRSSFGCGEKDRYPFFDGCVIESLPASADFLDLADRVKRCVARREDAEGMRPRSYPQLFVGPAFRAAMRPFEAP